MDSDQIEQAKRSSLGQVLFKTARLFNEEALARLRAQSGLPVRAAHTTLLPHIDFAGTRLTVLAQRVGVSKQAVHQLVLEMEAMGTLERVQDPTDGRARLIRFTEAGRRGLLVGLGVLGSVRSEAAEALGEERLERLQGDLVALLDWLEERPPQAA